MLIQEEIWKDIKGYEGYYAISNLGRVKSKERTTIRRNGCNYRYAEKFLRPSVCKGREKHPVVTLSKDGSIYTAVYKTLLINHFGKDYKVVDINVEVYTPKEGEVFRDIPGFEGKYQISNYGTVKSIKRTTNRTDGVGRKVSEKILAHNFLSVCLSKGEFGKVYNKPTSISKSLISSFYPEYDENIHYIKKVADDNPVPLHNYQYFYRLEHNPVAVVDLQGNYKRYQNYKEYPGDCNLLDLFFSGGSFRYNYLNISAIIFDHPVLFKGEIKLASFIYDKSKGTSIYKKGDRKRPSLEDFRKIMKEDKVVYFNVDGKIVKTRNIAKAKSLSNKGFERIKIESI